MKIKMKTYDLLNGVLSVVKALPVRTTMPILEGIFLEAADGKLLFKCSDLMLQKEYTANADVEEEGRAIVPGKLLFEMIRKLSDDETVLFLDGKSLNMHCGRAKSSIQCIEYEEFPSMRFDQDVYRVSLPPEQWKSMINETVFATAQDESKPILTGVLMEMGEQIQIVATDAYQFAMRSAPLETPVEPRSVVIPAKTMLEIARMAEDDKAEKTDLCFTKTHVQVRVENSCLTARLLDGDYIKYQQILPKEHNTRVLINRAELMESIDRAQLMAREGNNNIVMKFHDNKLHILANSFVGKINEEMNVTINGEDIDIAFNPKFCMNILKCIPADTICLDFTTSISPCVVRPATGEGYYYLIVPVRIYSQF